MTSTNIGFLEGRIVNRLTIEAVIIRGASLYIGPGKEVEPVRPTPLPITTKGGVHARVVTCRFDIVIRDDFQAIAAVSFHRENK
jgi:hypothetical protein